MSEAGKLPSNANGVSGMTSGRSAEPQQRSAKRWLKWAVITGAVLASVAAYAVAEHEPQAKKAAAIESVPTMVVQPGSLDDVIRLSGQVSARDYAAITLPILRGGRPTLTLTQLVQGGAMVRKGDIVAALDMTDESQNLEDAEDSLNQSQADLKRRQAQQQVDMESLQNDLRGYRSAMEDAIQDYRANDVKTPIDQELLKLQVEQAAAQYKQAQASEALQQDSIDADVASYQISYRQLLLHRDRIAADLKNFTFVAPVDGLAVIQTFNRGGSSDVQFQVGDTLYPGQTFLKIVDPSSMQLEVTANQAEARRLRVGLPATIQLDAFRGSSFPGKVYSVGAMATAGMFGSYYVRTVPVKVQIEGLDPRLIPDLSGAADITITHKENVLAVPLTALHSEGGKEFVYLQSPEGFTKQDVEIGLSTATHAEVVSGLMAGQHIALTTPPEIK